MKNKFLIYLIIVVTSLIVGCGSEDSSNDPSSSNAEQPEVDQPEVITIDDSDILTDENGISTAIVTLDTGEEIKFSSTDRDSFDSFVVSRVPSSNISDYINDEYSAIVDYSIKIESENSDNSDSTLKSASVNIKFKEIPNAIISKNETTSEYKYEVFFNEEDGTSSININIGDTISFFPVKQIQNTNNSSQSPQFLLLNTDALDNVSITKKAYGLSIHFNESLRIGKIRLSCLNGSCSGYSEEFIPNSNGIVDIQDITANGTYLLEAYQRILNSDVANPFTAVWEQDIFIENRTINSTTIENLAKNYAPILAMHQKEDYFPTSLNNILNNDNKSDVPTMIYHFDSISGGVKVPYESLVRFLAFNGHKDSCRKIDSSSATNFFQGITGIDKKTVYYSFIESQNRYFLNYHFIYAYDPKYTKNDPRIGNHIFDRESVTLIFNNLNEDPIAVIYSGHLQNQTMALIHDTPDCDLSSFELYLDDLPKSCIIQEWKGGRVYVNWKNVGKVENHPIVPTALGSHAVYPICGKYYMYDPIGFKSIEQACGDFSDNKYTLNLLIPKNISDSSDTTYDLQDLKLGSLDSYSDNSFNALMFSGFWVTVANIKKTAKFPPFTERESDPEKWADGAYRWNPIEDRISNAIISRLTHQSLLPTISSESPVNGSSVPAGSSGQLLSVAVSDATSCVFHFADNPAVDNSRPGNLSGGNCQVTIEYDAGKMTNNGTNYWYVEASNDTGKTRYLTNESLSFTVSQSSQLSTPDLIITNINAPNEVEKGYTFLVSPTVRNNGNANSSSFRIGIYQSQDTNISTSEDALLGYCIVSSLVAGATTSCNASVSINTTGSQYIGAIANYQLFVLENDFNNNTFSKPINVKPKKLTLSIDINGNGKVINSQNGINCSSNCSYVFEDKTSVTMTALPSTGYKFTGWDGACTGTSSCSISMTSNKSVTANFEKIEYVCGTFGAWNDQSYTSRYWNGSDDRDKWKYTPSWQEDSEHCYQYYTKTEFLVSSWGSADSYLIVAKSPFDVSLDVCSTYNSNDVYTSISDAHKGVDGGGYYGAGKVKDYGNGSCSGDSPLNDLEGTISVRFFYRIAPIVAK